MVPVRAQRAVTHTQAYVGNVLALLLLWQQVADADLGLEAYALPDLVARGRSGAASRGPRRWTRLDLPSAAIAFGAGGGWPAALELSLLLKEVAGVPTEGMETREGATSGMYALHPGHLVVSVPTAADPYVGETETVCAATGAHVLRLPVPLTASDLVTPITSFPAAVALAARLGRDAGLDVDAARLDRRVLPHGPHWSAHINHEGECMNRHIDRPVRVGIIGSQFEADIHAASIAMGAAAEVAAICSPTPGPRRGAGRALRG